jgi:hypothetical protein
MSALKPAVLLLVVSLCPFATRDCAAEASGLPVRNPALRPPFKDLAQLKQARKELQNQLKSLEIKKFKSQAGRLKARHQIVLGLRELDVYDPGTAIGKLAAQKDAPDSKLIGTVYRELLTREPEEKEKEICRKHLTKKDGERLEAVEDIVWAMLNSREYLALMTNPLPAESDTTKIEATFYSRAEKRDIRFPLPRRFWRAVTLTLLPSEVDAETAKWVGVGTLRISSKTQGDVRVGLYAPSKGRGAFAIRRDGQPAVYYRGGKTENLMKQLKEAHEASQKQTGVE